MIYGVVVERRIRMTTGFAVEAETAHEAMAEAKRLGDEALPGAHEDLYVTSVEELDPDAAAHWAERWDVPPAHGRAVDVALT